MRTLLFLTFCFFLAGCVTRKSNHLQMRLGQLELVPLTPIESSGDLSMKDGVLPPYNNSDIPATTRMFLVAAGNDSANFLQEVWDQQQIWLEKGQRMEEIAAYFAMPTRRAYYEDREQIQFLSQQISGFRRAELYELKRDIQSILKTKPKYLYLYVTSHGLKPKYRKDSLVSNNKISEQSYYAQKHPYFDKHHIVFGQSVDRAMNLKMRLHAVEAGEDRRRYFLSSEDLYEWFSPYPDVEKIIIIQGCYSGGFIQNGESFTKLTTLPNIKIITATRYDLASFGCGSGDHATYFGEALNRTLLSLRVDTIKEVDWGSVHAQVSKNVDSLEYLLGIDESEKSIPQFHKSGN